MATTSVHSVKLTLLGALAGGALAAAGQAVAQPVPPADPALPPAPPPAGAPFIPPVPGGDFSNTGQLDFLRELWSMGNAAEFFQSVGPGALDPAAWQPPTGYIAPPPPAPPGAPPAPAAAPPPVWPPVPIPAPVP